MIAPTEKAAPIPADVLALAAEAVHAIADAMPIGTHRQYIIARAILADREARPSLPDSREERIREDERDRLYREGMKWPRDVCDFLRIEGAMFPTARARTRQGGNNG